MIQGIEKDRCRGCGRCRWVCPKDIFGWNHAENRPVIFYHEECQTCYQCRIVCEENAIKMNAYRKKGETNG